jgi:hypothetical protein
MSSSGQPLSSNRPARSSGNAFSEAVASRLPYQSSGLQAARHNILVKKTNQAKHGLITEDDDDYLIYEEGWPILR